MWGNPYKDGSRSSNIRRYRRYLFRNLHLLSRLHELRGKRLGCWCAPKPCHCDHLARLANLPPLTVLVTGDRYWTQWTPILRLMLILPPGSTIVHGDGIGLDQMARTVAQKRRLRVRVFRADWEEYGRAAGPIRNQQMLSTKPDLCVAFHDRISTSRGTADMLRRAQKAGIPTTLVRNKLWIRK